MENLLYIIALICLCIILYKNCVYRPKIKKVKIPTTKQVRRSRRKKRFKNKIRRIFRIPYVGKTDIVQFDKQQPYIESIWDELRGKK